MRTWGYVNQKGGSGKTTLLLHTGLAACDAGETVAIVDTDKQKSANNFGEQRAVRPGKGEPVIVSAAPESLKAMVASALENGTDLLLIDTPGTIDKGLAYVAGNSDLLIIPTRSSSLDRDSLDETLAYLGLIHALHKVVVVYNGFSPSKPDRLEIDKVLARHQVKRLRREIEHNPVFGTLLGRGSGATEVKRPGKPAETIRAIYAELRALDAQVAAGKSLVTA